MTTSSRDGDFLSRWSRRKIAARRGEAAAEEPLPPATSPTADPAAAAPVQAVPQEAEALPPVESLTPESDFTPFMRPGVDPGMRQQALRTLVRAPGFNVMDGLDVYIDDYSKPDPIPAEWLGKLNQMARLGDRWAAEDEKAAQAPLTPDAAEAQPRAEITPCDQGNSEAPAAPASDTSAAGSTPPDSKQS